ncbi:hypothetical protein CAPTEDRAFT_192603 [Capitella teleta]|uniref:Uncharacterized protein n=1 Tax=Capitella teleta TaxID=283909 RepID=R7VAQ1_CAPTE|nr:hypothetical protein CAPTEDRAFT_192603 [Capitella teleta]|eukprot:ELU12775.1 hypothetical protein CAPTEDRAFT_192603 [Capitella teleta]
MNCAICREPLRAERKVQTLGAKGRKSLLAATVARGDEQLHTELESIGSPCNVHAACYKDYTRETTIVAAKRNGDRSQRRSKSETFSIKEDCFFCGKRVHPHQKLPKHRRKDYRKVETLPIIQTIISLAEERNNSWGNEVLLRIQTEQDLVSTEAKYHTECYLQFQKGAQERSTRSKGRPREARKEEAFDRLCRFLKENDECQFSLGDLKNQVNASLNRNDESFTSRTLKDRLQTQFGDNLIVTTLRGRMENIVTMKDKSHRVLKDTWDRDNRTDSEGEKDKIVEMAAAIMRDDIQAMIYDCSEYPTLEDANFMESLVPPRLQKFMHGVIKTKSADASCVERRCASIAHSIISACRPRSFISPILTILMSIAVYLYHRFSSKELICLLNSLGFSDDCKEVQRLLSAIVSNDQPSYQLDGFFQFVFDNADFNVATISGHNTFHSMGGIGCHSRFWEIQGHHQKVNQTSQSRYELNPRSQKLSFALDQLRMASMTLPVANPNLGAPSPSWGGFMQLASKGENYERTRIEILPFINRQPTNPSSIYTALNFAREQSSLHGMETCFVTFDQPLYVKANEIVASDEILQGVVVRLGGFHLLISFMGSVGYIMGGSGLEVLWESVYAPASVVHMMTGHAYARALRAHLLTSAALFTFMMTEMEDKTKESLSALHKAVIDQKPVDLEDEKVMQTLIEKNQQWIKTEKERSRTGRLWLNYMEQVSLIKQFIYAERTGDWALHLNSIRQMIPYFHAAGHLAYAKSARIYLQQMQTLQSTMNETEFSDMTRGRGITDNSLAKWVHAFPYCIPICEDLEAFANVSTQRSEQHKDIRDCSTSADHQDLNIFLEWLKSHSPFIEHQNQDSLTAISTGLVADSSVNCDRSLEIGMAAASALDNQLYSEIKLRRTDRVKSIGSSTNTVKIRGQSTVVNPMLLFNRITCVMQSSSDMEVYLAYELAPQPTALFTDGVIRKTNKSIFGQLLKSQTEAIDH